MTSFVLNGSDTGQRSLRIAIVAPPWYELPPSGYGGIEMICAALADGLVAQGHQVTVFGAGPHCGTGARFVSTMPRLQYPRLGEAMPELLHAARISRMLERGDFDVVHDHSLAGPLAAGHRPVPTVVTVHGPVDGELGNYLAQLGSAVNLVAISSAQRRRRPALAWAGTVHNGIDLAGFRPSARSDGPVLWLGRFCDDKGPDLAIEACRTAGLPLVLAGKCNEPAEERYFEEKIRSMLGPDTQVVLNADRCVGRRLLAEARCLIMPIRWHEPFGMVMIEAMASGTPVVALRRGSVPEVVRHSVTGWICDRTGELPEALHRAADLDPAACVAHVRSAFSADLMARRYERVYRQVIASGQAAELRRPSSAALLPGRA